MIIKLAKKNNKMRITVIFTAAVILITAVIVVSVMAMSGKKETIEKMINIITVETVTPEIGSISITGRFIGNMEPDHQVFVFPKLPGEVQSVNYRVGDTVKAGDILFAINATDIINSIKSLEAQLETQDAMVRAAETGILLAGGSAMQSQILSASGGVAQAGAAVKQAQLNKEQVLIAIQQREMALSQAQLALDTIAKSHDDTETLFAVGVVPKAAVEQAETAKKNAQIAVDLAQSALEQVQNNYDIAAVSLSQAEQAYNQALEGQRIVTGQAPEENLRRASDALEQAKAARNIIMVNLQTTREKLDDAVIKAPISGVIESRSVEPLNMASPQSPAFIISNKDSMLVAFNVPSGTASNLKIGDAATVEIGGTAYAGAVSEVGVRVNAVGLFPVKVRISGDTSALMTGLTAIVTVNTRYSEGAVTLPLKYVYFRNNKAYVYAAEGDTAVARPIEIGLMTDETVEILAGVGLDTRIISTWSPDLKDGAQIQTIH